MIRNACNDDSDSTADLYIESRKTHVGFAPLVHSEKRIRSWIRDILIPSGNAQVLEENESIVAMMATTTQEDASWIDQLYVKANLTSQGFGSLMLEKALKELTGPTKLHSFQKNTGARRFYEKYGFKAVEFTDGKNNQEKCPDILYVLDNQEHNKASEETAYSRSSS